MKNYFLVRFNKKSGKIDTTMSAMGCAMLKLWGLQHTTKTKDTIVFDEDGMIVCYYEGTGDFPKVCDDLNGKHVDGLCNGLLEAVKADC